ncbi:cytochrome P450 [Actinomadura sp. DC4]|uniref:cytochrome P450 n=1 Tax=Actinomadura sp. DC4 TaxID=3055069 RepID=UPI0025B159E1|nr:cytochrome P450 [Actinomadura sp. DC4]MDN3354141.1 cytochrome P450 [Actinomadura sp. DC4]
MAGETTAAKSGTRPAERILADLFGGVVQDPFPLYDELRETGDGVHYSPLLQSFFVTRYADVRRIATDHGTFSSDLFDVTPAGTHDPADAEHRRFAEIASRLFMFADPPVHSRIRSTFRTAFTPDAVERWRGAVLGATASLLEDFEPGSEVDIMPRFAADVPVAVIASILGVPRDAWGSFRTWSFAYASTFDPMVQGERRDEAIRTSLVLFDFLAGLAEQRRAHPADDLISTIVHTKTDDGDVLGEVELIAQIALLLVAGNETTTNLIGNGVTLLLDNPGARAEITAAHGLLPKAIEEMLRIDPPLHLTFRLLTKDATVGERHLPAGTLVAPCIAAANRDPRAFPDPGRFDIHRAENGKHLAFLHGIHFCVGAALARLEGQVVFEELLRHYPGFGSGAEPAVRRTLNAVSRGWEKRPVLL